MTAKRADRRHSRPIGVAVGSVAVVAGSALPWGRSGRADRSGFELVRLARRLDVLDGAVAGVARLWLLAPLVLAVVLAATVLAPTRRRAVGAIALGTVLAGAGLLLVVVVHRSPLVPRFGLHVTTAGAVTVLATDLWFVLGRRLLLRKGRPGD